MALKDPVAVYTADENVEAESVLIFLRDQGLEAYANEDVSNVFAGLCGIEKQQVWVDRTDVERAKALLAQYDHPATAGVAAATGGIDVVCEDCGQTSTFPIDLLGTIQDCPHCGAYVDVGEVDETGEWDDEEDQDDE